jgi:hypothetical protein
MNALVGWICVNLGFFSGFLLGLGFLKPGFLGGYDAPVRRLLRLGHIALLELGVLNILFALSLPALALARPWESIASWGLIAGAISMPLACVLVAWRRGFYPLFGLPVVSLLLASQVVLWGIVT